MRDYHTICTKWPKTHTRTHKNLKKCNAFDGVSKDIRDYYTVCTKLPKPCAKTNKNLKKCSTFDGVSKE